MELVSAESNFDYLHGPTTQKPLYVAEYTCIY